MICCVCNKLVLANISIQAIYWYMYLIWCNSIRHWYSCTVSLSIFNFLCWPVWVTKKVNNLIEAFLSFQPHLRASPQRLSPHVICSTHCITSCNLTITLRSRQEHLSQWDLLMQTEMQVKPQQKLVCEVLSWDLLSHFLYIMFECFC